MARTVKSAELEKIKKGVRIVGGARVKVGADLKHKYEQGVSIRTLAEACGRSYGFVHRILSETGVQLRGRGGAGQSSVRRGRANSSNSHPIRVAGVDAPRDFNL